MHFFTGPRPAGVVAVVAAFCLGTLSAARGVSAASAAPGERVFCHYSYGGETRTLTAAPVVSPYAVKAIDIGSYFHFRVVFQDAPADSAAVKVYTYADRDDGPLLIHQATWAYPPVGRSGAPDGFTGRQSVYEPVRDGELQYWCEIKTALNAGNGG